MNGDINGKKFAILIDVDNVSSKYIKVIIDETVKKGVITYRRIYGDFTTQGHAKWKKILLDYALTPMQQYSYTDGKNSTDSFMIIDAMDILYKGNVDGFCIVSSDSDFTRLAVRLREAGKFVIGMGEMKTPKSFVAACNEFKYLDLLSEGSVEEESDKETQEEKTEKTLMKEEIAKPVETTAEDMAEEEYDKEAKEEEDGFSLTKEEEIKACIKSIISEYSDAEGWCFASTIGTLLQNKYSDFDCRNYGCKRMIDLLEKFEFEIKVESDNKTYLVR